jgi:cytochrome c biogenesis protein CcdA
MPKTPSLNFFELGGKHVIMQSKLFRIVFLCIVMAGLTVSAFAAEKPVVDYYYGDTCSHCNEIKPFLAEVEQKNPKVRLNRIEVFSNKDNALRLTKLFNEQGTPRNDRGVPAIWINNKFLIGTDVIRGQLEIEIGRLSAAHAEKEKALTPETTFWAVTGAALVDSVNPCAIFVLIVLLSSLLVLKKPGDRGITACAAAFIMSVYIAYFFIGVGLIYAVDFFGVSGWLYKAIGFLAIVVGALNLKDAFFHGAGGFVMEIPRSWRPGLVKFLMKVSSPAGAFAAGFVVTLLEAPCTGGPYLFAIGLLAQDMQWSFIVPVLLYYNLVFVSPLIVIAALVIRGKVQVDKAESWQQRNIRKFHFIGGAIMTLLGAWMLLK